MKNIDINSDLGESFGAYTMGNDAEVLRYVTSANIACGFHASDPLTMQKAVRLAKETGVKIGAHPGYPDLVGFGRRELKVSPAELKAMVIYQVGALQAVCKAEGTKLHHVKPHGAMYNIAAKDEKLADAIAEAVAVVDGSLVLVGLSGSCMKAGGLCGPGLRGRRQPREPHKTRSHDRGRGSGDPAHAASFRDRYDREQ